MEAVGQLTGGIAHDFNNMLGVIMGNLELLQRRVTDDPKAMKYINAAFTGSERGASITKKLLSFSKVSTEDTQLIDVNEFIVDMESLISRSLTPMIEVEVHLNEGLWRVSTDPGDFEDALLNLSLNARDAMPNGGFLVISTDNKVLDEQYVKMNPGSTVGDHVMISLSDTGTGIQPDVIDRVFQPFFTTKEPGQGTGLGLSMVYGFVQRSGGSIQIYSEAGSGSTFQMFLPRANEKFDPIEEAKTRGITYPGVMKQS